MNSRPTNMSTAIYISCKGEVKRNMQEKEIKGKINPMKSKYKNGK